MKEALPIDEVLPRLLEVLRSDPAVVLEAPPGAGKTTRVPPALLALVPGEVIVLEPRRIAARAAAMRVAFELGERVGETVGYQVRFDEVASARTRLRFVTEGILARRLLADPKLAGVSALVLDEFHERHLPGDLTFALAQRLLPRVKLVVMSATLDAAPLAEHLGAVTLRSEGRRFPVEIEHLDKPDDRRLGDQVSAAVRKLTVPGTEGDVLVFLPGAAEIRHATQACAEIAAARDLLLLPLHGDLPADEQDRALTPARRRKVILSTNVAETSVTVPGVTAVVDSGLARIAGHSAWSGLPSLQVAKISRASATQRAGRAGRTAPGRALRLYTKHDFDSRPEHHAPEIERLDLAGTVLELRAAGIDPERLSWLDPPPPASMQTAQELLSRLGLVEPGGAATVLGRECARFPLHPRLSRLLMEAARRGFAAEGCAVAALLNERDLRRDREAPTGPSDVLELFDALRSRRGVDAQTARRVEQARDQLLRIFGSGKAAPASAERGGFQGPSGKPTTGNGAASRDEALLVSVLAGFPDRVAKRRGASEVLLAAGGAAQLARESAVREAELMVAVDAEERREAGRTRAIVRLASAIEVDWLLDLQPDFLREETQLVWEPSRERVETTSRLLYEKLVLEESRKPAQPSPEAAQLLLEHAQGIPDADDVARLQARLALARPYAPDLPELDVQRALREAAAGFVSLADLRAADLQLLDGRTRAVLDRLVPEQVALANSRKVRVEYILGQPPAIHSRLQDFFGAARGPSICDGRVPLTLHLLAPNGRAQQITQDLAGFWQRHYPAVRRELMRKYPRHSWPENGATATPPPWGKRQRP
ncbi:MAG TPA: ATP-dependent helicase HrpB [Myxococcales bacterium]